MFGGWLFKDDNGGVTFTIPVQLKRINGGRTMMVQPDGRRKMLNTKLVRAVAKGYMWNHMLVSGQATSLDNLAKLEKIDSRYIRKLVKLAWLAPDVLEAIVDGRESETMRLGDYLAASQLEWPEQRLKLM